jgi:hypothetical protein
MRQRPNWPVSFAVFALLSLLPAAGRIVDGAAAAERPLSEAQLEKIKGWIAEHGSADSVNKIVTDILGLTQGDETISSRALAVRGSEGETDIHQIDVLPNGRGYLEAHFHDNKAEIYWADVNFTLQFAVDGVRGARPDLMSFPEAEGGLHQELSWWARFADTH